MASAPSQHQPFSLKSQLRYPKPQNPKPETLNPKPLTVEKPKEAPSQAHDGGSSERLARVAAGFEGGEKCRNLTVVVILPIYISISIYIYIYIYI